MQMNGCDCMCMVSKLFNLFTNVIQKAARFMVNSETPAFSQV